MKLELSATPKELQAKGDVLISNLAKSVREHNPELADKLEKATGDEEEMQLRDPFLRELHHMARARYQRGMASAHKEISSLFDGLEKSQDQEAQSSLIDSMVVRK